MKNLMTLLLVLIAFTVTAQQFTNPGFEDALTCPEDCTLPNSQMTCVPGWDASSGGEIKYVQSTNCEGDIVCTGQMSILLESNEDEIFAISTDNPLPDPENSGIPPVITVKTHVLSNSASATGVIVNGTNGSGNTFLGQASPSQQGVCEDMTILLGDFDNPHTFSKLDFSTGPATGGNVYTEHSTVIDDVSYCGPLITIDHDCSELTFQLADCNLASFIHEVYLYVSGPTGEICHDGFIDQEDFGDPIICPINVAGEYYIDVGLVYNFNPDLLADLFTTHYVVESVGPGCCLEPVPDYVIVDADGNPKTEFCPGEEVFIDGSGSENEDRWFLSIWQYNIGGLAAEEDNLAYCRIYPDEPTLTFEDGQVPASLPLNPIWGDCFGTPVFAPGFEYRIQLVVTNDCYGGWHAKEDEVFIVKEELIPDYIFVDEFGNPKDTFCFGEDVFIDGSASENEEEWFLSIWQYNIGGLAGEEDNLAYCRIFPEEPTLTFEEGQVPASLPLNPIWDDCFETPAFAPGFEYRIQLVVKNECENWKAKEDMVFYVVCCNDEFSADPSFKLDQEDHEEDHYTIIPIAYELFENLNATHEWYVYSGDYPDGPFTPITIIEGETFSFESAEYGVEYFVIHKVITDCGERCFRTCTSNGGGGAQDEGGEREASTCLGEEIDCDLIDDIFPQCSALMAPANLQVSGTSLTWAPVPGAVSYTIYGQIGGPSVCNCGDDFQFSFTIGNSTTNSISVPAWLVNRCFQWTVVANCGDGVSSMSSEPACYAPVELSGDSANSRERENTQNAPIADGFSVFPNPANDYFEVSNTSANDASIGLYHINGQLISINENVPAMSRVSVNTKHLSPGLYLLNIRNKINGQLISTQKIIIQR